MVNNRLSNQLEEPIEEAGFTLANLSPTISEPLMVVVEVVKDSNGDLWEVLHSDHAETLSSKYRRVDAEWVVTDRTKAADLAANQTSPMWSIT
jgi:hypothetical protein